MRMKRATGAFPSTPHWPTTGVSWLHLPADFVAALRRDRDALNLCNSGKHSDNLECVESTSSIETLLGNARAIKPAA